MNPPAARMLEIARAGARAVWVRVERVRGSAPREPGASMLVTETGEPQGTIGGGRLEFEALAHARRMLAAGTRVAWRRFVLGASLGQCCGGEVELSLRAVDAREFAWIEPLAALARDGGTLWLATRDDAPDDAPHSTACARAPRADPAAGKARVAVEAGAAGTAGTAGARASRIDVAPWHVWVFGAGHVGGALVRVLATMPLEVTWVDPRGGCFPPGLPPNIRALESDGPAHEVAAMPAGADALVMTHSHALDFDLCLALLAREDLGSVGLIGSATKAASFRARLARRGVPAARVARLRCPIGVRPEDGGRRDPLDRHPGAIAVAVAFELWTRRREARADDPVAARGAVR